MSLFMDRAMRNLPQGDLRSEIAGSSSYYQCIPPPCPPDAKVCPVCETPSFDDTDSRNMLTEYKMFVEALRSKNLLFLSGIVGPPFKNYKNADGKDCNVTLYLIQRDGRSDYNRAGAG